MYLVLNNFQMQVIMMWPYSVAKSGGANGDFGHLLVMGQHADGFVRLTSYDFLLLFCSYY